LVLLLYLLLWLPPVQQKIKDVVLRELMKETQGKMSIGNLKFSPFNHLLLEDIYAADLKGDTLLYAENLKAGFNLFKLLNNQLLIHSVELDNFAVHLSKDSINSPYNFQFLADVFASDTTQTEDTKKMIVEISDLLLKNGRLTYDVISEPFAESGLLDFNHIDIMDFNATVHLKSIDLENLDIAVPDLLFKEKSGFSMEKLTLQLRSDKEKIYLDNLTVALPQSEWLVTDAVMDYSGADYSLAFSSGQFSLNDLACLYPALADWPEKLTFSGEIHGTLPQIDITRLQIDYGKHLQLTADAGLADFNHWESAPLRLNLKKLDIDEKGIKQMKLPAVLETLSLNGEIDGSLPDLNLRLEAFCGMGNLFVEGTGGYLLESGMLNGNLSVDVRRWNYNGYTYRNVKADVSYMNDSVAINLNSEDVNLPLRLDASAYLSEKNPSLQLSAVLSGVQLDSLHFLPEYPGSKLSGKIDVDVDRFDPEHMSAFVTIDNLNFATPSGVFDDSPIVISYKATANNQKQLNIRSKILNVRGKGQFSYAGINQSLKNAFPVLFPRGKQKIKHKNQVQDDFNFLIAIRQSNTVTHLLGMETEIPDSALFVGKYIGTDSLLTLQTTAFCVFSQSDTARIDLTLSNEQQHLLVHVDVDNNSSRYDLEGNLGGEIEFIPAPGKPFPDMNIALRPGSLTLNGTPFMISPAQIMLRDKRYEINNLSLRHSYSEYLKLDGIISNDQTDSLQLSINRFQIGTLLEAIKNKFPLSGVASGDITAHRILDAPLVFTRNFSIEDILFDGNEIGNLSLTSGWNSTRQGLMFRAALNNADSPGSLLSGYILPEKDSLYLTGDIKGIKLEWFIGYLPDTFYDVDGEFGARIKAVGKITSPALTGMAYLKDATVGIKTLNTTYRISDSVSLDPDKIVFKEFIVYDETRKNSKINGSISHKQFSNLTPKLTLDFNNFLALNNELQTDSLFYGLLRVNGSLNVISKNNNWIVQGKLSNGKANHIMLNIPESVAEAQRYSWVTYVNTEEKDSVVTRSVTERKPTAIAVAEDKFSLPLKLQLTLSPNSNLNMGVMLNPSTKDAAQVTGSGAIDFSYDLNNSAMNLQGNYEIEDGKCTLSLKNITRKTFAVQQGGKLNFRGDPMNTTFDVTAVYSLRSDLTTLDPGFGELLGTTKVPVNCLLTASGSMKNMQLKYNIKLPNEPDETQRKLDGLIYTDDIKIKEIAYLLALGSFMPVNSNSLNSGNSNIWTSLASSSITTQLNNLLSGVLNDNWTIGTDLHTKDTNFSEMDMDVNVSTRLFDNRLTLNSTLGYHNNQIQNDNFTGDFDLEYKLSPGGNVILRFYNVTNNQYYDKSKSATKQGLGVVYKRTGRTFRQLFKSFRTKRNERTEKKNN
jgi:hypothetical protein